MDVMKILAELYLHQLGIEAIVETVPIEQEERVTAVSEELEVRSG